MQTLSELIDSIKDKENYWTYFAEWLNQIFIEKTKRADLLSDEPSWECMSEKDRAFFAGVAHFVARKCDLDIPEWIWKDDYFLKDPYFSLEATGKLRMVLLAESPQEFRIRNIFISANTLNRV